jgi:hypothetical protein
MTAVCNSYVEREGLSLGPANTEMFQFIIQAALTEVSARLVYSYRQIMCRGGRGTHSICDNALESSLNLLTLEALQ